MKKWEINKSSIILKTSLNKFQQLFTKTKYHFTFTHTYIQTSLLFSSKHTVLFSFPFSFAFIFSSLTHLLIVISSLSYFRLISISSVSLKSQISFSFTLRHISSHIPSHYTHLIQHHLISHPITRISSHYTHPITSHASHLITHITSHHTHLISLHTSHHVTSHHIYRHPSSHDVSPHPPTRVRECPRKACPPRVGGGRGEEGGVGGWERDDESDWEGLSEIDGERDVWDWVRLSDWERLRVGDWEGISERMSECIADWFILSEWNWLIDWLSEWMNERVNRRCLIVGY